MLLSVRRSASCRCASVGASVSLCAAWNKHEKVAVALTGVQPSLSGELSGDGGSTTMLVTFTESSLHGSLR